MAEGRYKMDRKRIGSRSTTEKTQRIKKKKKLKNTALKMESIPWS